MANPNFVANYSTNEIFRNEDTDRCLTDDLDTIESDIADLETNKADSDHTHSGYAATDHTHTGFASESHTHTGYAATSHTHSEYAGETHTHGQTDITGLVDALAAKANVADVTTKADLVDGKVPASQLPAFVDDVLEYANLAAFPTAGESGKIYVAQDTNKTYRWSGSAYVEISSSIALGETAATAYRGDRGATAYTHSQNSDVHVTAAQKTAWDSKAEGNHSHTPAAIGAAPASHTHDYAASNHTHTPASIGAAPASHTHTDNVLVQKASGPAVNLTVTGADCKTSMYKNANATADNGTTISDYASDGTRDSLILARGLALTNKLRLVVNHGGDETATYAIYGEHHKPTAAEVGALALTGGTVTGETNFSGGLVRLKGTQTLYHSGSQLIFGSNNLPTRIGGSAITATQTIQVDSDERLKENVAPVDAEACIKLIADIAVKTFNYIGNDDPCMGVIAQELANNELAKFFVSTGPEGYMAVKEAGMIWPTIVALQKAIERIEELEAKVATLEAHKCNCK